MKKIFKNILTLSFIAFSALSFNACQEYEINSQPEAPVNIKIDAMEAYTVLATNPQNIVFNVSSNTPWEITSDQQWCTVTPSMSATSSLVSEIVVTCEPNNTAKQRVATLTISAKDIENTTTVKLTQVSKENLVVIPYDEVVPTEGGTISFKLVSNKPWTITPSTMFVENIDKTSGEGNETGEPEIITVTIPENAGALRRGTITVKTEFEEFPFEITQDGVIIEPENPTETGTIDFQANELEKVVKIRSNQEWKVEVPDEYKEWLSAEKLTEKELKITVLESNRLSTRKASLKLTTEKLIPGFEGIELPITQKSVFVLNGGDKLVVDETTGNVKVGFHNANAIQSNYKFKKGTVRFDFESINFVGNSRVYFNFDGTADANACKLNFYLSGESGQCKAGLGGGWWQAFKPLSLTLEEINQIKMIEFLVEDDVNHSGKLRVSIKIDEVEKLVFDNVNNIYPDHTGTSINCGFEAYEEGSYFIVKSITHTPAE